MPDYALFFPFSDICRIGKHLLAAFQTAEMNSTIRLPCRHRRDILISIVSSALLSTRGIRNHRLARISPGTARDIIRNTAATYYNYFLTQSHRFTKRYISKEIYAWKHTRSLNAGYRQSPALLGADREHHRRMLLGELLHRDILAHAGVALYLNTKRLDNFDFRMNQVARQPVFRNPHIQHASGNAFHFINCRLKPHKSKIMSTCQPGRPRTDNGHFAVLFLKGAFFAHQVAQLFHTLALPLLQVIAQIFEEALCRICFRPVFRGYEPLEDTDRDRVVNSPSSTSHLARRRTDSAAY